MTPDDISTLFTSDDGQFLCARWARPVAPVAFGLADETLTVFHAAITAAFRDARHPMVETDPDMGANLMVFAVRDWPELRGVPDLDRLTGRPDLPARLVDQSADQYRLLRFDPDGGIRACLTFLRLGGALGDMHPAQLAESVAVNALLSFARRQPPNRPLARLIRAAYDPILPVCATDPAYALRLFARLSPE